jgi:DNA (cytosine-5)-methyltransferase 1
VVRDLQERTRRRLKAAQPGKSWLSVEESLRPDCHRAGYNGFTNVYGRMNWDALAVTVTSGCTTPCKGRFGHPDRRRTTISVREAASLQTFPNSYAFLTDHMDAVCEMIGNAVPPEFAKLIGIQITKTLGEHYDALARKRAG